VDAFQVETIIGRPFLALERPFTSEERATNEERTEDYNVSNFNESSINLRVK
jgi:hypothetical protein